MTPFFSFESSASMLIAVHARQRHARRELAIREKGERPASNALSSDAMMCDRTSKMAPPSRKVTATAWDSSVPAKHFNAVMNVFSAMVRAPPKTM